MNVSELMTSTITTVAPTATMNQAAQLMSEHDIGCLPITDGDHHLTGIVTDRDMCLAASTRDLPMSSLSVREAMTTDVVTVGPATPVEHAERLMRERQLHRLPVVDDQRRVIGMISLNDLAHAAANLRWQGDDGLSARDVSRTLAAIHEHRASLAVQG